MIVAVDEDYKAERYRTMVDEKRSTPNKPILVGEYTRAFDVLFDNGAETAFGRSIIAQRAYMYGWPIMPQPFSSILLDNWVYVDHYEVDPPSDPLARKVWTFYKSFVDPSSLPIEKELYFQNCTDILDYAPAQFNTFPPTPTEDGIPDSDARELTNSAGEPLDPAVIKEYRDLVMRFRFYKQYDFKELAHLKAGYIDSVNRDRFYDFDPGYVKCISIDAVETQIAALRYNYITMEFAIRTFGGCGWLRRFLDQGFRERRIKSLSVTDGDYYEDEQIKDLNGDPISRPAKLDGHGNLLATNQDGSCVPWFLFVRDYNTKSFAPLNLE
jgi:hypothetical protein